MIALHKVDVCFVQSWNWRVQMHRFYLLDRSIEENKIMRCQSIGLNNSGYRKLAVDCSFAFLRQGPRASWGKVLELHPWWWHSRCDNYWCPSKVTLNSYTMALSEHIVSLLFLLMNGICIWYAGENGTIDGQGGVWWNMWRQGTLQFTRPNLIELINSKDILISNIILRNSPFWNVHPVYCRYGTFGRIFSGSFLLAVHCIWSHFTQP